MNKFILGLLLLFSTSAIADNAFYYSCDTLIAVRIDEAVYIVDNMTPEDVVLVGEKLELDDGLGITTYEIHLGWFNAEGICT